MVKILFAICLLLFGCFSYRNHHGYESFPIDKERQESLDEDFNRYLNYFTDLDTSRDGYYLVYNLYLDAFIQENAEQYSVNKKIFNRFDYLVSSLYEAYALNETRQSDMISEDVYEKFKRDLLEKQSNLEREYRELLFKYPNVE